MPDEMVAWLQQLGDRLRLRFEVASVDRWVRRIARAIRNHQRVAVGQRPEGIPRRTPVAHASVHEDDPRSRSDCLDVKRRHGRTIDGCTGEAGTAFSRHCKQRLSAARCRSSRRGSRIHAQDKPAAPARPHSLQAALQATPQGVNKVGRKWVFFVEKWPLSNVTSSAMLAVMEPSRPTFEPAGAGMLLSATTAASLGVGALVGWAAGSVWLRILRRAVVRVPAGIGAVYFRY